MATEDPALEDVTEKELLLEIFRQTRAIRRLMLFVVFGIPAIAIVLIRTDRCRRFPVLVPDHLEGPAHPVHVELGRLERPLHPDPAAEVSGGSEGA